MCSMAWERKLIVIKLFMMGSIIKDVNPVKVPKHFKTGPFTSVCLKKMQSQAKANSNGQMAAFIMENGKKIKCTDSESTNGKTAENTKENTYWTRNTGKVFIHGVMVKSMMDCGLMANNMVGVLISLYKAFLKKECGILGKESAGFRIQLKYKIEHITNEI